MLCLQYPRIWYDVKCISIINPYHAKEISISSYCLEQLSDSPMISFTIIHPLQLYFCSSDKVLFASRWSVNLVLKSTCKDLPYFWRTSFKSLLLRVTGDFVFRNQYYSLSVYHYKALILLSLLIPKIIVATDAWKLVKHFSQKLQELSSYLLVKSKSFPVICYLYQCYCWNPSYLCCAMFQTVLHFSYFSPF